MKINIKNLKGEMFGIEADPTITVPNLKTRSSNSKKRSKLKKAIQSNHKNLSSKEKPPIMKIPLKK